MLRRRALGTPPIPSTPPIPPPSTGGLATLGEDDEDPNPCGPAAASAAAAPATAPSPASAIPAGVFAVPRPRGPTAMPGWQVYWDERRQVHLPSRGGTFNVYLAGGSGPVVLCLHGGGYTGLTWSLVAAKLKLGYRVVAPDLRGHGLTATDSDTDFSRETMAEDVVAIWEHLFGGSTAGGAAGGAASGTADAAGVAAGLPAPAAAATAPASSTAPAPPAESAHPQSGQPSPSPPPSHGLSAAAAPQPPSPHGPPSAGAPPPPSPDGPPAVVLVGHSMGGGLAVWAAMAKRIRRLEGVVVLDVVEGTALAALPHMANVLAGRPAAFASAEEAVTWAVRSGMSRNREAAAMSIPSQLVKRQEGPHGQQAPGQAQQAHQGPHGQQGQAGGQWVWRTPLELSRPYWEGWYRGLSDAFMQLPCPKALVLAGTDRLDRSLTIGQMQGRFQLILMPTAGHAIHEDEPDRTAEHLLGFLHRFRVGEPPLTFPRAPAGTRPALPVVAGPVAVGGVGSGAQGQR